MRICFHLQIKDDRYDDYVREHAQVWPEVQAELKAAGIRDYSLWYWKDGHEFGVLECDDWESAQAYLGQSDVMAKWEAFMAGYLATPVTPGKSPELLKEIFRLD